MRTDSYRTRLFSKDQLEFFVKLYEQFKKLVPFMMAKNTVLNEDGSPMESIEEILHLPHMDKLKADLAAKALKNQQSLTTLPSVFEEYGSDE